jgi:exonuclease SbcD
MKLLHTGDLHLGKSLHESSLIEDQKIMLDQLVKALAEDDYAALVIAGDVYDRTIPSAEAVELFSSFLARLRREFPTLEICVIPGNHDSSQRLSYANRILSEQRIHIVCSPEESFTPIITAKNDEKLALFLLPFLAPGTLAAGPGAKGEGARAARAKTPGDFSGELDFSAPAEDGNADRGGASDGETPLLVTQSALAAEASRRFARALGDKSLAGIPTVLVAHLFTLNGKSSDSERAFLGNAEEVDPALFSGFTYVALGHLHREQAVTERMRYSGSPLAYAFDEAGTRKAFLKVEIGPEATGFPVTVTPIPVTPFRKVTRLSGAFADFYSGTSFDAHAADYLEITLTDDAMVANPMNLLRPKFPWLLSLRQGLSSGASPSAEGGASDALAAVAGAEGPDGKRDPLDDFARFEELLYGFTDEAKRELFSSLLAECADEA